jgi:hypothetical protein
LAGWLFRLELLDPLLFFWTFASKTGLANRIKAETRIRKAILMFCLYFSANMICLLSLVIILKASALSIKGTCLRPGNEKFPRKTLFFHSFYLTLYELLN